MVAIKVRELTAKEKAAGKKITVIRRAGRTLASGFHIVDPKTGRTIGEIATVDVGRFAQPKTTFRGRGMLFQKIEPVTEVAASIRRSEEKKESRELAQKEAEFEARRIRAGKIKPEDVVLTRRGAAKILREKLEPKVKVMEERIVEPRKLREQLKEPKEVKPRKAIELFSPLARERLGITETPEGLLEIRKGERKVVLEPRRVELPKTFIELVEEPFKKKEVIRREVKAELPLTAEFSYDCSSLYKSSPSYLQSCFNSCNSHKSSS